MGVNHAKHWHADPNYIARPGDTRLRRLVVFKRRRVWPLVWIMAIQERNCLNNSWRSINVFEFDDYADALRLVRVLLKDLKEVSWL